ncbi:MAG: hypothetical protein HZA90_21550 [Verrucomicrobia bacterium]|nr:hypothetical protein [Verrucomicrobiota bacterium]
MRTITATLASLLASLTLLPAQSYTLDWFTLDGGGGTSTNGGFTLTGTIGQPDAGVLSGGGFTLQGGFWGTLAAVQTEGAPFLSVVQSNDMVVVSWPKPADGFTLQCAATLTPGTNTVWTPIPPPYRTNVTCLDYLENAPTGARFYRLWKP